MFTYRILLLLALCIGGLISAPRANAEFSGTSAKFDNDAIFVCVEEGVRRVRLRALNSESGAWELVQIVHLSGDAGHIKLRVPEGMTEQELKVEVSNSDPFPYAYYSGKSSFGKTTSIDETANKPNRVADQPVTADDGGEVEVAESDIWHIQGERLYFFNQLRGLQIFGLNGDPEPTKLGSLRLPAVGEQMYVLDDRYTILLAAWASWNQSEVILAEYDEATGLREAHRIALPGSIAETRLIGDLLYVVTRFSEYTMIEEPVEGGDGDTAERWVYKNGLDLTVIDFSDPSAPRELQGLQLAEQDSWGFYNAQVSATSTHILVSTTSYANQKRASDVYVIDISDQESAPALVAEVPVSGEIADKFKMRLDENVLTTVSQVNDWSNRQFETVVETFEIGAEHEDGFSHLDEVRLGFGEQLFATRFDGDRLYIVTFLRIDPFWVVDLADPKNLRILGELEVPGFSRYLQPVGDNILAIGVEDRVVTASLFNATDPTNPQLLSRISMGEGYSWSEANYDEKAISFNEAEGLLLVPYQSYNNGQTEQKVQIIDLVGDSLTKRGTIQHGFPPRRAGLWNDRIVSVSGRELIVVDATNRDDPAVLSETVIAWNADRVIESGGYLFQLEEGYYSYWGNDSPANSLRVTTADDPETLLSELPLGDGSIIGAEVKDGCLYLLASMVNHVTLKDGEGYEIRRAERTLRASVVDISDPPSVKLLGQNDYKVPHEENSTSNYYGAGEVKPIWLPGGRIAWASGGGNNYWGRGFIDFAFSGDVARSFYYQPQIEVHVVDVIDKASPVFLSSSTVSEEDAWSYSMPFLLGDDQIAFSYQKNTWLERKSLYLDEYRLRVVDLENPASPVMLDEVSIPGRLSSVVRTESGGTVLITEAQQSAVGKTPEERWWQDAYLQASVYDGHNTFLLDEVAIPDGGSASSVFQGAASFRQINTAEETLHLLGQVWDPSTGLFVKSAPVAIEQRFSQLAVHDKIIFGWQRSTGLIGIDISDPLLPGQVEKFPLPSNLWLQLERIQVDRSAGAWLPTGAYGVDFIDFAGVFDQVADSNTNETSINLANFSVVFNQVANLTTQDVDEWIDVPFDTIDSHADCTCNNADLHDNNNGTTDSGELNRPNDLATSPTTTPSSAVAASAGKYTGFLSSADGERVLGCFKKIKVSATGQFSAKMFFGNIPYSIKGILENGQYSGILTTETGSPITVNLQLVRTDWGAYKIEGTVKVGSETTIVQTVKAGGTSAWADAYTLLIPGEYNADKPKGNGFATMKVTALGKAKIKGLLGDGSKWTTQCAVTPDGEMPLYTALYRKPGWLGGMVRFRNVRGVSDCDGEVHWQKLGSFDLQRDLIGSRFRPNGCLVHNFPNGLPNLELHAGSRPSALFIDFEWGTANKINYDSSDKLEIRVSPKNGRIRGKFPRGDTQFRLDGVVFQKQGLVAGMAYVQGGRPRSLVIMPVE